MIAIVTPTIGLTITYFMKTEIAIEPPERFSRTFEARDHTVHGHLADCDLHTRFAKVFHVDLRRSSSEFLLAMDMSYCTVSFEYKRFTRYYHLGEGALKTTGWNPTGRGSS